MEILPGQLVRLTAFCKQLRQSAKKTRGIAGHTYLEKLVAEVGSGRKRLVEWLEARMAWYLKKAKARGPVDERVAQRFALIYAAGCLAVRYGVLPYSWAEISAVVRYCHGYMSREASVAAPQATLALAKTQGDSRRLLRRVAKNVVRHRRAMVDLRRRKPTPLELRRAVGFTNTRPDGERELLFTPAKFRQIVCGGEVEQDVIGALKREGLIHLHQGGKTTIPRNLPDPLGRMRVVCLKSGVERLATSKE